MKMLFENVPSSECVLSQVRNQTPGQPERPSPDGPQEVPPGYPSTTPTPTPYPEHPVQPETRPQTPPEVPQPDPAPMPGHTPPHAKTVRFIYRNKSWTVRRTQLRLAVSNKATDVKD